MSRELILEKYFLNIKLQPAYSDLYLVRKSILKAIQANIQHFNGSLLDIGCGIMPYRELILKEGKVNKYIGLDFENPLDSEYALGKPDLFWKGDTIPLSDNSIDTAIATEFFEHSALPEQIMLEIARVLKPGGVLFLTVPFLWNLHSVPYDEYRYTPFSLERHLKNAGYVNIKLTALGGMDASLAQMIAIWLRNRPLKGWHKKIISPIVMPVIKKLINMDSNFNKDVKFTDGQMITGLWGIAYKSGSNL